MTETELQAAAFRRWSPPSGARRRSKYRSYGTRGLCRNCLSKWYAEAAAEAGEPMTRKPPANLLRDALRRVEDKVSDATERLRGVV